MPAYDYVFDFWDRLPSEWDSETGGYVRIKDGIGRTDEQLDSLEEQCGFKLPRLYREQYKVQNGGYPKREIFKDETGKAFVGRYALRYEDNRYAVFVNDSHMPKMDGHYYSIREWLYNIWDDEEIAENLPGWNLDRLVIISYMWGHSILCLDYGYREGTDYPEPQVICIETDNYEEEIRVPSYEEFVAGLVQWEY